MNLMLHEDQVSVLQYCRLTHLLVPFYNEPALLSHYRHTASA